MTGDGAAITKGSGFGDREADMRRESRAEPQRLHLVAADAFVPQPQLDDNANSFGIEADSTGVT